jgi:hypothetical protein
MAKKTAKAHDAGKKRHKKYEEYNAFYGKFRVGIALFHFVKNEQVAFPKNHGEQKSLKRIVPQISPGHK